MGKIELVFILDRSGSMSGLEADTIGGFNAMLKQQKGKAGIVHVTTVLFDDRYELLHDRIAIDGIKPITEKDYAVRGSTALLDAIGKTIHKIDHVQKMTAEEQRADQVLFIITTDGMENASREYSYDAIRQLIEGHKNQNQWEFIFLGANIDAIEVAQKVGIDPQRAVDYHGDGRGTQLNYEAISDVVSEVRASRAIPPNWKSKVDADYKSRKKQ